MKRYSISHILFGLLTITMVVIPFCANAEARGGEYVFRQFSPQGGFYYDGVKSIRQDGDQLIWAVMDNDVYRLDGYTYKRYYPQFKELGLAGEWEFRNLATNSHGELFVSTNNGIFRYNKLSDRFELHIDSAVQFLYFDGLDNMWVRQSDGTLCTWNEQDQEWTVPLRDGKPFKGFFSLTSHNQELYISNTYGKIFRYDYAENSLNLLFSFNDNNYLIQKIVISGKYIWALVRDRGLYKIGLVNSEVVDRIDFFSYENRKYKTDTKTFVIDNNNMIWLGAQQGMFIIDPQSKEYTLYRHNPNDALSLVNNSVWEIAKDSQNNLWIGTFGGGLSYVDINERAKFKTYLPLHNGLNYNVVSGFAENDKTVWVATEGAGINVIDKATGRFSYLGMQPNMTMDAYTQQASGARAANSLSSNNIKSIVVDEDQSLWIATFKGGLNHYNQLTQKVECFLSNTKDKNSLRYNDMRKIVLEPGLGLWVAYQAEETAISFFDLKTRNFTHYKIDNKNQYIFDIYRQNGEKLWILTHESLYLFNTKSKETQTISLPQGQNLNGQSMCSDSDQNLWIGTVGNGLLRYDHSKGSFTSINEILKFNVSTIFSISTDQAGDLWLGTDNGLFKYDVSENRFFYFSGKDGVQGRVFSPLASMQGKNGKLYIGGTNGFTVVNTEEIVINTFKPRVTITDFLIDNTVVDPSTIGLQSAENTNKYTIDLSSDQSNFGFRFTSNSYLSPEKNRFRYRLRGLDDRWVEVDASQRVVQYYKIPAGRYTFEVMATNNDSEWAEVITTVDITCRPPFMLSIWAFMIYAIILSCVGYLIFRYYMQHKKLRMQIYLDGLEGENKEKIHQSQLRFFTNISHDFRTPLSLILAAVERMRQEGLKDYYYRILNGNAQRLLNLVNELMDFRTVENGKMDLKVQKVDLRRFIEDISASFTDFAAEHSIDLIIAYDPKLEKTYIIDPKVVEKIVVNLVNNALKYTQNGGNVKVEIYAQSDNFRSKYTNNFTVKSDTALEKSFAIVVSDNGVGISKESIGSVFERFYKVKTNNTKAHLGTGVGLALVKSLVVLHKGEISIHSEREVGTDMVVSLSALGSAYRDVEFLADDFQTAHDEKGSINIEKEPSQMVDDHLSGLMSSVKKRILLAEDNDDLRGLIAGFLSQNYDVEQASDGVQASQILARTEIDLILSDIMMPCKDGVELCEEVKHNIATSHIPFVMLTAKIGQQHQLEGASSGADLYLEKPIDLNLLLVSLHNIFSHQQSIKAHYAKNYYAESSELATNDADSKFLHKFISYIDANIDKMDLDVSTIASEFGMSRSKLYTKIKALTDKSIVEFILNYKLRLVAKLIIENNISIVEAMDHIGIESQSYFTRVFKKEFGLTPAAFAAEHKKSRTNH